MMPAPTLYGVPLAADEESRMSFDVVALGAPDTDPGEDDGAPVTSVLTAGAVGAAVPVTGVEVAIEVSGAVIGVAAGAVGAAGTAEVTGVVADDSMPLPPAEGAPTLVVAVEVTPGSANAEPSPTAVPPRVAAALSVTPATVSAAVGAKAPVPAACCAAS